MSTETARSWLTVLLTSIGSFFSTLGHALVLAARSTWKAMPWILGITFVFVAALALFVGFSGAAPWAWVAGAALHDWVMAILWSTGITFVVDTVLYTIVGLFVKPAAAPASDLHRENDLTRQAEINKQYDAAYTAAAA